MRGPSSTSSHGCFFPEPPTCSTRSASKAGLQEPGWDGRRAPCQAGRDLNGFVSHLQHTVQTHCDGLRLLGYKKRGA